MKYTITLPAPENELSSLVRFMHEAAHEDFDRRGVGFGVMHERGLTWVLIRLSIRLLHLPRAGETLSVSTWPTQTKFGLYPRRYELRSTDGELLAQMCGMWVVMDMETRHVVPWQECSIEIGETSDEIIRPERRLHVPEGGSLRFFSPDPSQIDDNFHMNNVAYLDEMIRSLGYEPDTVQLEFEHEVLPDDRVALRMVETADACLFEGRINGLLCFRGKTQGRIER